MGNKISKKTGLTSGFSSGCSHIKLGETIPNFEADGSMGKVVLHDYLGEKWGLIWIWSRDFDHVVMDELREIGKNSNEFAKRNIHVLGLSCDSSDKHKAFVADLDREEGVSLMFPVIGDEKKEISKQFDLLHKYADTGEEHPIHRTLIIDPEKRLRCQLDYPTCCPRSLDEIFRIFEALQSKQKTMPSPESDKDREKKKTTG